jgi:hypothetical protein
MFDWSRVQILHRQDPAGATQTKSTFLKLAQLVRMFIGDGSKLVSATLSHCLSASLTKDSQSSIYACLTQL